MILGPSAILRPALGAALCVVLGFAPAASQQRVKMDVGSVPTLSGGPTFIAKEKGYYAAVGLDVEVHRFSSSSEMAAMIGTNKLQVVGGALSAGFFNSIEKDIPVKIVLSRNTTPTYNIMMLRTDLKDTVKTAKDLKGRTVALVARGSIVVYQTGRILETAGLTLKDIETKYMPFPQMAIAFQNKAIDAAIMLPPLSELTEERGFAFRWIDSDDAIKTHPVLISVEQMNMDWAQKNPQAARDYVYASLRGVRDYCLAYHGGPNRAAVVKILAKYTDVNDEKLIETMEWGARDPLGRIFEASMMDIQDFYIKEGMTQKRFAPADLAYSGWLEEANAKLGAFTPPMPSSRRGCR